MFTEIVFEATHEHADSLTDCLLAAGALSATLEDADAGLADEHPLFGEPGGEPLVWSWNRSRIVALFDGRIDAESAVAAACRAAGLESVPNLVRRQVASEDWVSTTQAQFEPIHIGKRIWIVPSWRQTPPAAQEPPAIVLRIDPGLAFGTGSHPTTRLCLEWLEAHLKAGASVIDYGCGSGILAIAAKKLGAGRVVGIDIDEQAIIASVDNAELNECEVEFVSASNFSSPHFSSEFVPVPAEVVVANILSNPLKVLAPLLCGLVASGGSLVLSGVLRRQAEEVAEAYVPLITLDVWRADEDWVCLHGTKPVIAPTNSREANSKQKAGAAE